MSIWENARRNAARWDTPSTPAGRRYAFGWLLLGLFLLFAGAVIAVWLWDLPPVLLLLPGWSAVVASLSSRRVSRRPPQTDGPSLVDYKPRPTDRDPWQR